MSLKYDWRKRGWGKCVNLHSLGNVLCIHKAVGEMRTVKDREVTGTLQRIMKSRSVSKKGRKNSTDFPILSYSSETWTWNTAQQA